MTTYCQTWNPVLQAPIGSLAEAAAAEAHRTREPYVAIVREAPRVLVELCFFAIYCHVRFFDDEGRKWLVYSFRETGDGRLFLRQTTLYQYDGDSTRPSSSEVVMFEPDGAIVEDVARGGTITRREGRADVSSNVEPIPDFGRYESLARAERDSPSVTASARTRR